MTNQLNKPTIEISFDFDVEKESRSPESWYVSACELIYVQKQLENNIVEILKTSQIEQIHLNQKYVDIALRPLDALGGLSRVYMYLSGIIFENLSKAIIIQKTPDKLKEITSPVKGHDLPHLIHLCGFNLSEKEISFFQRISTYVFWAGRF